MNRWKSFGPWLLILGLFAYTAVFTGCSEDSEGLVDPERPTEIDQLQIICRDLAPAPGDSARLTIQVAGYSPGEWPTYTWDDGGSGSFPNGNTGISVKWMAPSTPGLYRISVIGTLSGKADTTEKWVMVRNFEEIDTGRIFSCQPRHIFNSLYFFGDEGGLPPRNPDFKGYHCYRNLSPGNSALITDTGESEGGGFDLFMPEGGTVIVGSFIRSYFGGLQQQRQDLWSFPLSIGSPVNITDDGGGQILRKNQHVSPFVDPFGTKVVWEAREAGPSMDGTEDLSNIGFWENFSNDTIYVTESHDSTQVQFGTDIVWLHRYYNNIKPMITPDEDLIIYFVDTTGVFEPCLMDLSSIPDISSRRALMVTDERGIFETAGINVNDNTVFQWNTTMNIVGFIAGGDLCFFDPYAETVMVVPEVERATEFAWSPDGTQCAVVTETGVWIVSSSGMVSGAPVYVREKSTDGIVGLAWSEDPVDPKLAFRMIRKGKNVEDSFSALVMVYINDGISVYASPSVNWSTAYEPMIDYTYMRLIFVGDGEIYAPIPTPSWSGDPERTVECSIFRSYE